MAPGLALARGGPGRTLNVYLLGDVVVDAGMRWSRRRLARQLVGRPLSAHLLTTPTSTTPAARPGWGLR